MCACVCVRVCVRVCVVLLCPPPPARCPPPSYASTTSARTHTHPTCLCLLTYACFSWRVSVGMAGSLLSALSRRTFDSSTNAAVFSAHVAANAAHSHSVSQGAGCEAHRLIHALSPCNHQHTHTQPQPFLSPLPLLLSVSTPCCPWRLGASMPSAWYCTLTRKYTCSGACSRRTTNGVLALRGSNDSDSRVKLDTSA